jgi:hypothetical protein
MESQLPGDKRSSLLFNKKDELGKEDAFIAQLKTELPS